ncbi:MAG: hypothetical protein V1918_09860 [Planctomycetota bacterium]
MRTLGTDVRFFRLCACALFMGQFAWALPARGGEEPATGEGASYRLEAGALAPEDEAAPVQPLISQDGLEAAALWERFVLALRQGDMRKAYDCFSPPSRETLAYEEFGAQFSPLTALCEAILSPAADSRWIFGEGKAVLTHLARPTETGAPSPEVRFFFVWEEGAWWLVSLSRWPRESLEADARAVLHMLDRRLRALAKEGAFPATPEAFQAATSEVEKTGLFVSVEEAYEMDVRADPAPSWEIRATPRRADAGLRAFVLGRDGEIRAEAPSGETPRSSRGGATREFGEPADGE